MLSKLTFHPANVYVYPPLSALNGSAGAIAPDPYWT